MMMHDVQAYLRERIWTPRIALLSLLLVVAASGFSRWSVSGLVLLVAFRLLDDLEDVEVDRIRAPERVLVRASSLRPFWWVCGLAFLVGGSLLPVAKLLVLVLFTIGLLAWYRVGRRYPLFARGHSAVILTKYPLLVWLTSAGGPYLLATMCGVYLVMIGYERLHDPCGEMEEAR